MCLLILYYDFFFILGGGRLRIPLGAFFRAFARARAFAPPFVLLVLQSAQYQMSGMAVRLTLAQVRWTQILQDEHSIIGLPPYGFLQ